MERELTRRENRTRLLRYKPYAKQAIFHTAGATNRERLLMAANQVGKTYSGAAEAAIHLTGTYPDWVGRQALRSRCEGMGWLCDLGRDARRGAAPVSRRAEGRDAVGHRPRPC